MRDIGIDRADSSRHLIFHVQSPVCAPIFSKGVRGTEQLGSRSAFLWWAFFIWGKRTYVSVSTP